MIAKSNGLTLCHYLGHAINGWASLYVFFRRWTSKQCRRLVGYLPNKRRQQFNLLAFALCGQVDLFSTLLGGCSPDIAGVPCRLPVRLRWPKQTHTRTPRTTSCIIHHYVVNRNWYFYSMRRTVCATVKHPSVCLSHRSTAARQPAGLLRAPWGQEILIERCRCRDAGAGA